MPPTELSTELPPEMKVVFDKILEPDTSISADGSKPDPVIQKPPATITEKDVAEPVKKEEQKASDTKEEDDLPADAPKEKGGWDKFRERYDGKKKEAKELREQLTDFEGTRKERDELKERIAKLEEQNQELGKIDSVSKWERLEGHKFEASRNKHVDTVKRFAGIAEISPEELLAALHQPEKQRYTAIDDMLSGVTPTLQTKIRNALDAIEGVDSERQAALSDVTESLSKAQKQQQDAQRQYVEREDKMRREVFQSVASDLAKELDLSPEDIKDAEKFFLGNDDLKAAVKVVLREKSASNALASKSELMKKLTDMETELKQYRGATPGLSAGQAGIIEGDFKGDAVDVIVAAARKAGAFSR